jgi:hypothetical protein
VGETAVDPVCGPAKMGNGHQGPGTVKMSARLAELARTSDPGLNIFLNDKRAMLWKASIERATNEISRATSQLQYANELVKAGYNEQAVREFEVARDYIKAQGLKLSPQTSIQMGTHLGLAYMRMAEQRNCLSNHNADSCLFPITGGGVHQWREGSENAIRAFSGVLEQKPDDLGVRWLLNIAYMTLGDYPGKVPTQWLVPTNVFQSEYELPRFPDGAAAAGLDIEGLAGGCIAEDFDGDGLLDVMASSWGIAGTFHFFHNNGDGTFVERTREAGLLGLMGGLHIVQTDYNNDGLMDFLILRGAWMGRAGRLPNSLMRNNGDGTFEDVTEAAGMLSFHPTQAATWFDFDGDGWLDLFIGNESSGTENHPCELYHNNRDGTFTECALPSGVDIVAFIKGVSSGDYDNDGRPDLYISTRGRPNILLHNDGPGPGNVPGKPVWKFSDRTTQAGVGEPIFSFPNWFFDYDNDGWLDIFVSGYAATINDMAADALGMEHKGERMRLYHNNRDGTFSDVTKAAGMYRLVHTMGSNFGDLDNDGWLDMYLGTGDPDFSTLIPNRAFRNNQGKGFQDVTTVTGTGNLQKGHSVAFADFDNNGSQDIFTIIGGAYQADTYHSSLFVNPGNSNHWITLKVEGEKSNRAGVGTRIKVDLDTPGGPRSVYKTVCNGGSFGGNPLRQEIGLGDAKSIKSVTLSWPATGKTQTLTGLEMNRFYRIRENSDQAEPYSPKRFQLSTAPSKAPMTHQHPMPAVDPSLHTLLPSQ